MSFNNDNFFKFKSIKINFKKCSENYNVGKIQMIFKFGIGLVLGLKLF